MLCCLFDFYLSIPPHDAAAMHIPYETLIATGFSLLRQPSDALTGEPRTSWQAVELQVRIRMFLETQRMAGPLMFSHLIQHSSAARAFRTRAWLLISSGVDPSQVSLCPKSFSCSFSEFSQSAPCKEPVQFQEMLEGFAPCWPLQHLPGCDSGHVWDCDKPCIDSSRGRMWPDVFTQTSVLAHSCANVPFGSCAHSLPLDIPIHLLNQPCRLVSQWGCTVSAPKLSCCCTHLAGVLVL